MSYLKLNIWNFRNWLARGDGPLLPSRAGRARLASSPPRPSASPCRAGRTPFSHRGSPRKGDGVTLVLTLRDCTLAEAVAILKEMGISVTVAA